MAQGGDDDPLRGLFDHRIVQKPKVMGNDRTMWKEWKFEVTNFMCLVHAQFTDDLRVAEAERSTIDDSENAELRRRSTLLYSILASITKDRAKQIVMQEQNSRNGYEVWRLLIAEFEPRGTSRRLFMLRELCKAAKLQNRTEANFYQGLLEWEQQVMEYDRMPSDVPGQQANLFHEDLKRAVVMGSAPDALQTHLALLPAGSTYAELRAKIEGYLRSKGAWALGESVSDAMEVDAATWSNECHRCGKQHRSSECPYWQHECRTCGKVGHLSSKCRSGSKGGGKSKDGGKNKDKNGGKTKGKDKSGGKNKDKSGGKNKDKNKGLNLSGAYSGGWQKSDWSSMGQGRGSSNCYVCGELSHAAGSCPRRWRPNGAAPMDVGAVSGDGATQVGGWSSAASEASTVGPSASQGGRAAAGEGRRKARWHSSGDHADLRGDL